MGLEHFTGCLELFIRLKPGETRFYENRSYHTYIFAENENIGHQVDCMIVFLMIGLLLSHSCVVAKYTNRGITARGIRGHFSFLNLFIHLFTLSLTRLLYEFQRYEMASGKSSINIC